MSLGENIKKYRKSKKFTQKALGEKIGRSEVTIQKYEAKKNPIEPPYNIIQQIAEILEVDISDLLGIEVIERMKFESSFNLDDFDPYILKIFNDFKEELTNNIPSLEVNSSEIMQNMLIDYLARYKAEINTYKHKTFDEFMIVDNKLYTGKKQFEFLYDRYYKDFIQELKSNSFERLSRILVHENLEDPTPGFLKMVNQHIENFGEKDLSPQLINLAKKIEKEGV